MVVSYSSLLESAHRVGRALHHLDDPQLVKAVAAEAAVELAAVDSAELGDPAAPSRPYSSAVRTPPPSRSPPLCGCR